MIGRSFSFIPTTTVYTTNRPPAEHNAANVSAAYLVSATERADDVLPQSDGVRRRRGRNPQGHRGEAALGNPTLVSGKARVQGYAL